MAVGVVGLSAGVIFLIVLTETTVARQAPIITDVTTDPPDGYFYNLDTLTFACVATGTPTPTYSWLFNDVSQSVNQTFGELSIPSATVAQAGRYECHAWNQYGTAMSYTVVMQLAFIGDFSDRNVQSQNAPPGSSTPMTCRGAPTSAPQATYGWATFARSGSPSTSGIVVPQDNRRQVDQSTGTLHFANVLSSDHNGTTPLYGCLAGITTTTQVGSYVNFTVNGAAAGTSVPTNAFRHPATDIVNVIEGQPAEFKCFFYGK